MTPERVAELELWARSNRRAHRDCVPIVGCSNTVLELIAALREEQAQVEAWREKHRVLVVAVRADLRRSKSRRDLVWEPKPMLHDLVKESV